MDQRLEYIFELKDKASNVIKKIKAEQKDLTRKVQSASKQMSSSVDQVNKSYKTLSDRIKAQKEGLASLRNGAGIMAVALSGFGGAALKAASDLNELQSKAEQVFKANTDAVRKWSDVTSKEVGRAKSSLLTYATDLAAVIQPTGVANEKLVEMSQNFSKLAVDLASFHNKSDIQAFNALRSAITGEIEPLKQFGVVMTEANLQAFALSQGIKANVKDLNQAEKAQLRYAFIMANTTVAQGDAERTADGLANQYRRATENVKEFFEQLGQPIMQTFADALAAANEKLASVTQWFSSLDPQTKSFLATMGAGALAVSAITAALAGLAALLPGLVAGLGAIKVGFLAMFGTGAGLAVTGLAVAFGYLAKKIIDARAAQHEAAEKTKTVIRLFKDTGTEIDTLIQKNERLAEQVRKRSVEEVGLIQALKRDYIDGELAKDQAQAKRLNKERDRLLQENKNMVAIVNAAAEAELKIGAEKVKQRIKMAHESGLTEAKLIEKLLSVNVSASNKELEIVRDKLLKIQNISNKFKGNLAKKFSTPIIQEIIVSVRDGEGFLSGIKTGLNKVRQGFTKTAQDLSGLYNDVALEVERLNDPTKDLGINLDELRAAGTGAGQGLKDAAKQADDAKGKMVELAGKLADAKLNYGDLLLAAEDNLDKMKRAHDDEINQIVKKIDDLEKALVDMVISYEREMGKLDFNIAEQVVAQEKKIEEIKSRIAKETANQQDDEMSRQQRINELKERENFLLKDREQLNKKLADGKGDASAEQLRLEKLNAQIQKTQSNISRLQSGDSVDSDSLAELKSQLAKEQQALEEFKNNSVGLEEELVEAKRRANLTDFERTVEDIKKRKGEFALEHLEKKELLQEEIDDLKKKEAEKRNEFKLQEEAFESLLTTFNDFKANFEGGFADMAHNVQLSINDTKERIKSLEELIARLTQLTERVATLNSQIGSGSLGKDARAQINRTLKEESAANRELGGPVRKGAIYEVGESGKELFVPNTNGRIISNNQMQKMGGDMNVNLDMRGTVISKEVDAEAFIEKVKMALAREVRLQSLGSQ